MRIKFFATVALGIEDVACREVEELVQCEAVRDVGKVFFEADLKSVYILNLKASTLNKIMVMLCRGCFAGLKDIYSLAKNVDYGWIMETNQSFAVRSERVGFHKFTSMDVSKVVGKAIIDSYLETYGRRLKVNLDEPDVEICALVRNQEFILGVNTTGISLHRRGYRIHKHPAALKPTLASAMLKISGWTPDKGLVDPMCGCGTIPIEAAFKARNIPPNHLRKEFAFLKLKIFDEKEFERIKSKLLNQQRNGEFKIYGLERFRQYLNGALKNSERAKVKDIIKFKLGDATKPEDYPQNFEFVIVNPPYGVRMVPCGSPKRLYCDFLKALKEKVSGATLVLITAAYKKFKEAAEGENIEIFEERTVCHGELTAKIFKCKI